MVQFFDSLCIISERCVEMCTPISCTCEPTSAELADKLTSVFRQNHDFLFSPGNEEYIKMRKLNEQILHHSDITELKNRRRRCE